MPIVEEIELGGGEIVVVLVPVGGEGVWEGGGIVVVLVPGAGVVEQ